MKTSFCGVAANRDPSAGLRIVLNQMVHRPGSGALPEPLIQILGSSGIAIAGTDAKHYLIEDEGLVGAISGTPYWSNSELENLSRQLGFAKSVAAAYRRHGADLLLFLRGAFSLALTDPSKDQTILAIDRMGISQLYYSHKPGAGLAFGTNAGQLQRNDQFRSRISDQAIFEYLYFHMVPSPRSIYENEHKMRPGERLVYSAGTIEIHPYWNVNFNDTRRSNRRVLENELHNQLRHSLRRQSVGGEIGCFLSGGIDSSTIAGLLSEMKNPAKTFTIGFQEEGYDETSYARITSDHFQTKHEEYIVTPEDVVNMLPVIARTYSEPFGNSSVVPAYFCARMARNSGVDTLLGGDGGDELFAGNVRYVTQQIFSIYDQIPGLFKKVLIEPLAFGLPGASRFLLTRKLQSYVRQAKVPMPDRLETYNYFNQTAIDNILHSSFLASIEPQSPVDELRETYAASSASTMLNKMLQLDWKITLADNDLRKVITMCELADIDVQFPFLDDGLVEFSASVPSGMKIKNFRLRHFFKRAMRSFLPREVLTKSKQGFGLPFGIWMKSYKPLQDLAYDCLSDIGKRNIVRPAYLDELIDAHSSAHAHYYGEFIWVLMMLELWFKEHDNRYEVGATR